MTRPGPAVWGYVVRRSWHGFLRHRGFDAAAALSFFAALTIFPVALAVVSAVALTDDRTRTVDDILSVLGSVVQESTVDALREPLRELLTIGNPGWALTLGILLALWSVSGYATAFGRAMNAVYEVQEGRRIWKFRGLMLIVAVVVLVAFSAMAIIVFVTPALAQALAEQWGAGGPGWVTVWDIGKWPLLLVLAVLLVTILYWATPNVRLPRKRWASYGAFIAIGVWAVATTGFALYVVTVSGYERVYGWLGGGIVLLVWLFITNLALVAGAEVDAETVRVLQLVGGAESETRVQIELRDTTRNLWLARQRSDDEAEGRRIRLEAEARRHERAKHLDERG
ncbi:YihY/virulence factor BrkB family protein [Compostimonas suwonensis]|uniref:Membrane protein n=1 Tax=Compostimonas suwonensis TaxID=1048394 RepID=A0A2M9BU11_9MICO|nr:YihY/virulence factor BrkB family protein [Compostimonas suwonensis]PJJ61410.1 membrane protein [Compostimonas suwonensis]